MLSQILTWKHYLRDLGEVQKIWIDPKDVQAPIKLENVFWIRLYPEKFIAKMQEIGPNCESRNIVVDFKSYKFEKDST